MLDANIDVLIRPRTISEMYGSTVEKHIKSILNSGLINHTYLFSGEPGSGKTTLARNLAKYLITGLDTSDLDLADTMCFTEVNGTKYGGKDEIKQLVDQVANPPITGSYIILLIDEAQGLTSLAQSVLLKIMEEPPPHLYIFLCTTDKDKIRGDIRDRCYKMEFPPLTVEYLMSYARQYVIPTFLDKADSKALTTCKINLDRLSDTVLEKIAAGITSPSLREIARRIVRFLLTGEVPVADIDEESDISRFIIVMLAPKKTVWRDDIKKFMLTANDPHDIRIRIANSLAWKLRTEIGAGGLTLKQVKCYNDAIKMFVGELDYACSKADLLNRIMTVTLSSIQNSDQSALG